MANLRHDAALVFTVTQAEIDAYAALSGANDPIHVDVEGARSGPFGSTIAQGLLVLGRAVAAVTEATQAANCGAWLEVDVAFVAPVRPDDPLSIRLSTIGSPEDAIAMKIERLAPAADGSAAPVITGTFRVHKRHATE
jgi:acyl dehydratase